MSVSIDLTGGFDSRLVACLMKHHGVEFETALSGYDGHIDQEIGEKVSAAIGASFYFTEYNSANIIDSLDDLLLRSDSLCGNIETCHRLHALTNDRKNRNIEISLKGQGGEMYKDFFWTQDFPFYKSPKSNLSRLHRLRIEMELLSSVVLTPEYFNIFNECRESRLDALKMYLLPLNTQSYDNIYFRERIQSWNGRTISSSQYSKLPSHSPLCEVKLAQIGYAQPRSKRFYSRVHREYIAAVSPLAASIITTDGTSARSDTKSMFLDGAGYTHIKLKKLVRKTSQLVLNKTYMHQKGHDVNADASSFALSSKLGRSALETLKVHGIVQDQIEYSDISPRFRSNFLVLGWFLENYTSR